MIFLSILFCRPKAVWKPPEGVHVKNSNVQFLSRAVLRDIQNTDTDVFFWTKFLFSFSIKILLLLFFFFFSTKAKRQLRKVCLVTTFINSQFIRLQPATFSGELGVPPVIVVARHHFARWIQFKQFIPVFVDVVDVFTIHLIWTVVHLSCQKYKTIVKKVQVITIM